MLGRERRKEMREFGRVRNIESINYLVKCLNNQNRCVLEWKELLKDTKRVITLTPQVITKQVSNEDVLNLILLPNSLLFKRHQNGQKILGFS